MRREPIRSWSQFDSAETGGELSETCRYDLDVGYTVELRLGGKRLPEGLGITQAENFKASKNVLGEFWK